MYSNILQLGVGVEGDLSKGLLGLLINPLGVEGLYCREVNIVNIVCYIERQRRTPSSLPSLEMSLSPLPRQSW